MPSISIIIPVYNRPEELKELLYSLSLQQRKERLEVVVIDDGSVLSCKAACDEFARTLPLSYAWQPNMGPGPSRNRGAILATGQWLYFLDSDCTVPTDFVSRLRAVLSRPVPPACFGTRDEAHPFFTSTQKAVSYAMTSRLTTGGIRGGRPGEPYKGTFYPRSFSMGISRGMFDSVGGFSDMRYGEDVDLSMRVAEAGGRLELVTDTCVYHKRRTTLRSFFWQVYCSGTARVDLARRHKHALRPVHLLPSLAVLCLTACLALTAAVSPLFLLPPAAYAAAVLMDAHRSGLDWRTSLKALVAAACQVCGYGTGLMAGFVVKVLLGRHEWVPGGKKSKP